MENAIINSPHNEVQKSDRNIDVVTAEIRTICMKARSFAITSAIEVGRRLEEAKAMLSHGEWGIWLKERTEFSQSTANNLMRLYAEYGNEQIGLFGAEMNSQTLGKLTYTKALKLLALPEDERESFVEENDVENMSTRELDKLIKERDEALKKAEAFDIANDKLAEMEVSLSNAKTQAEQTRAEVDRLTKQLDKAKAAEEKAKAQAKMLKDNPTLSDDAMAKIKAEADAKAAEEFKKQLEDSLSESAEALKNAERAKEEAEYEKKKAQARLEEIQKQAKMADPAVAEYKALFNQAQQILFALINAIDAVKDEETKSKLRTATNSLCKQYIRE